MANKTKKLRKKIYAWECSGDRSALDRLYNYYYHYGDKWYNTKDEAQKALNKHKCRANKKSLVDHCGHIIVAWADNKTHFERIY